MSRMRASVSRSARTARASRRLAMYFRIDMPVTSRNMVEQSQGEYPTARASSGSDGLSPKCSSSQSIICWTDLYHSCISLTPPLVQIV